MTSTTIARPASVTAGTTDTAAPLPMTRFFRRGAGIATIAAGALSLAGFALTPWENGSTTEAYLLSLKNHAMQAQLAAVVLHFGYAMILPAVLAMAHLARRRGRRFAIAAVVFGVIGATTLPGLVSSDFFDLTLAQQLPMQQAIHLSEAAGNHPALMGFFLPGVFGTLLATVLATVAVWRARVVRWYVPVLMVAGWVATYQTHTALRAISGFVLVFLAFAIVGVRILRTTDEQWAAGRAGNERPNRIQA